MNAPTNERIRIRFAKFGRIRFTSHRDVARMWERALRRSRVPVAYSEGFSPRPKLSFGLALATSYESCGEYLDVDLLPGSVVEHGPSPVDLATTLTAALPPGMTVQATESVERSAPSLQESVLSCDWLFQLAGHDDVAATARCEGLLGASELPITRHRKGKDTIVDLRPNVHDLRVVDVDELPEAATWPLEGALVRAELGTHPRAVRPADLLAASAPPVPEGRVLRLHQWTTVDGQRREPLPLGTGAADRDVASSPPVPREKSAAP